MSEVTHFFNEDVTWIDDTGDVGYVNRVVLVQFTDHVFLKLRCLIPLEVVEDGH